MAKALVTTHREMEGPGRPRDLRRPQLGQGLLRHQQGRPRHRPSRQAHEQAIDLKNLVDQLQARGIQLPILLRFTDILRHRVGEIHDAFQTAIKEYDYQGEYCCVYPIKVNQQRHVVEEILDFGKPFRFGLEAGSKPELLAVLALTNGSETPIICNGFKDDEFIKMAVLARKIGKHIIPVVEKFTELESIVRYAEELDVRPVDRRARQAGRARRRPLAVQRRLPLQVRPDPHRGPRSARVPQGSATWPTACSCVHFHLGSQITNIRNIKNALTEAARVYVELHRVGAGRASTSTSAAAWASTTTARRPTSNRRVNYTLQEYANDVVFRIKSVCDEAGVPHPTIISESGRAVVAYHSVLVFDVLGVVELRPLRRAAGRAARRRAAADRRPVRHLPRPEQEELPGELPRRRAGDGRGAEPLQPRLPDARDAGPGRTALLGGLRQDAAASSASSTTCPRSCKSLEAHALGHLLLQLLDLPVDARLAGRSSSSSRSCRSTG